MVEQDEAAIVHKVRKRAAQIAVRHALVFDFGIALVAAETAMPASATKHANSNHKGLLQNQHEHARNNIIRIASRIVEHCLNG